MSNGTVQSQLFTWSLPFYCLDSMLSSKITTILKEVKEMKRMVAYKDEELERKERELEQLRSFLVASTP